MRLGFSAVAALINAFIEKTLSLKPSFIALFLSLRSSVISMSTLFEYTSNNRQSSIMSFCDFSGIPINSKKESSGSLMVLITSYDSSFTEIASCVSGSRYFFISDIEYGWITLSYFNLSNHRKRWPIL